MLTDPAPMWTDHVDVTIAGGQVAALRPLHHDETAPLLAVFDGMSVLSRARRYLTGIPHLPPRMLRTLTDVGRRDHVAWLATIDGEPVGVGRYVAVTDTWRRWPSRSWTATTTEASGAPSSTPSRPSPGPTGSPRSRRPCTPRTAPR